MKHAWVLMLAMAGCASLDGRYIQDPGLATSESAEGVSYFLTKPSFEIQRKTTHQGKKARPVYEIAVSAVPDATRRFEVGMSRGWFSSDSFEVQVSASGALSAVSSESADVTAKVVAGLAKLAAEVAGALLLSAPGDNALLKDLFQEAESDGVIGSQELKDVEGAIDVLFPPPPPPLGTVFPPPAGTPPTKDAAAKTLRTVGAKVLKALEETDVRGKHYAFSVASTVRALDKAIADESGGGPLDPDAIETEAEAVTEKLAVVDRLKHALSQVTVKTTPVAKTLQGLKKTVDETVAKAVIGKATSADVTAAVMAYKDAVKIVLDADEALGSRALRERRQVLVDFLKSTIPPGVVNEEHTAYVQLSQELNQVSSTIASLLGGGPAKPAGELQLATDVTSRIDERVHVDRFAKRIMDPVVLARHVAVARARVLYGGAGAALVVHPLAAPPSN